MSDSESWGWASSEDVVVGNPSPAFEARLVKPEFDSSLYRPDTSIDGWSNGRVVVRAASVRGYQHRYDGSPRQDDFALLGSDDGRMVFLAVADGLSSARNSHIGSSYATRYAVRWLNQSVASKAKETDGGQIDWEQMLSDCMRSTSWFLLQETARLFGVEKDVGSAARLTATTLVCAAVITEDDHISVYSVSVGDSGVWLLADREFTPLSGGKSLDAGGIADSSVQHFLPGGIPETFDVAHHGLAAGSVLLLGSDGFGDPLGSGRGAVGDLFRETFEGRIPSRHEFAHVLDFQRETFDDDRTLVGVWPGSGEEAMSASPRRRQQARRDRHRAAESSARPAPPDGDDPKEQGDTPSTAQSQEQADPRSSGARPSARPSLPDARTGPGFHDVSTPAPRAGMKPVPTGTDPSVGRSGIRSKRSRASVVEMAVVAVVAMIVGLIGGRYIGQEDQGELPELMGPVTAEVPSEGAVPEPVGPDTAEVPSEGAVPEPVGPDTAEVPSEGAVPEPVGPDTAEVPSEGAVPEPVGPDTAEVPSEGAVPEPVGPDTAEVPSEGAVPEPVGPDTAEVPSEGAVPEPVGPDTAEVPSEGAVPEPSGGVSECEVRDDTEDTPSASTTTGTASTVPEAPFVSLQSEPSSEKSNDDEWHLVVSWRSQGEGGDPIDCIRVEWLEPPNPDYPDLMEPRYADPRRALGLRYGPVKCEIRVTFIVKTRSAIGWSEQAQESITTPDCSSNNSTSGETSG